MHQINWQAVAEHTRELYPLALQIAAYSRNRWVIVFPEDVDNFLGAFHPLDQVLRKHKAPVPLVVTLDFIKSSLDSYPLEFLDIQSEYTSLFHVEDILGSMHFNKNDVRLQIEREIKGKWLLTRQAAIQHPRLNKHLFSVLKESFTSLLPVFKGFCYLQGQSIPKDIELLIVCLEEILHTEMKVFRFVAGQNKAPSQNLLDNLFNDYIRLLGIFCDKIDTWDQA